MARLREQRPPISDQKPGARSNRPSSTSTLCSYYRLASYACVGAGGINDQLTRSIDDLFCFKLRKNLASLPQSPVWSAFSRYRALRLERASASPTEYRSILCATKMSLEEDVVLETASLFAQAFGPRLCLLHIRSVSKEDSEQCTPQSIRQAFDRECRAVGWGISTDVCVRILNGKKTADIRQTASEQGADLIIVGRGRERGVFSRAFSQLCTIIRESPCPVLSV